MSHFSMLFFPGGEEGVGFATHPSLPGKIICLQIYRTLLTLTDYRSVRFRASIV